MTAGAESGAPPRRALPGYLLGATSARTGDEMSGPAILLAGLTASGSVGTASALLTGLTSSAAIGGPLLGVLLDRSPRPGRVLGTALACYGAGLVLVVALLGRVPTPALVVLAVAAGLFAPAVSGGWTAQLPDVVGPAGLSRATGLDAMTFSGAALAGPALVGILADAVGTTTAVSITIALVVAAVPAAWRLPSRVPGPAEQLRSALVEGLTTIVATRSLLRATATSMVSFAGVGMLVVACPLLGALRLGDASRGALLLAGVAATGLAANAVLARRPTLIRADALLLTTTILLAVATAVAALPGAGWVVGAALLAGLGEGPQLTALIRIRHRDAPEHLRARVFTLGASLKITAMAAGTALAGVLATQSVPLCLLTAAAVQLGAAALFGLLRPRRR